MFTYPFFAIRNLKFNSLLEIYCFLANQTHAILFPFIVQGFPSISKPKKEALQDSFFPRPTNPSLSGPAGKERNEPTRFTSTLLTIRVESGGGNGPTKIDADRLRLSLSPRRAGLSSRRLSHFCVKGCVTQVSPGIKSSREP